ncbi:Nif3-like dinuclear metal center hexameric protein, partial [Salmonella enterica subsp. enterica serovar Typhimurium]|nr:Nif3-like dinuclear metal center hexameric protein [Salmonella enterica subsp. enterica serovar Typhimurium]
RTMTLSLPPLLFLHANGYPAGVYRRFLEPLAGSRTLHAIEALGADAQRIAVAGDDAGGNLAASLALIDAAIERGAQAIVVHHGWFWRGED